MTGIDMHPFADASKGLRGPTGPEPSS